MFTRRHLPAVLLLVAAAASVGASVASAQTQTQPPSRRRPASVGTALSLTPPGTLATVNPAAFGGTQVPTTLGGDYASLRNANSFGVRLDQRGARLQAGVVTADATDDRGYMGAVGYGGPLYTRPLGAVVRVHLGYDVAVGYGRYTVAAPPPVVEGGAIPDPARFHGLTVGSKLPVGITYTPAWTGFTLTPYFAPGYFYGRTSVNGDANDGRLATLGGGVRVETNRQVIIEAGLQQTQYASDPIYGLGVSYRFGHALPR